uniref:Uncharacterized protein n=1 Tax=Leersia perrieri TaxID=77586 RepID=A0A0D9W2G2_9ORYZ
MDMDDLLLSWFWEKTVKKRINNLKDINNSGPSGTKNIALVTLDRVCQQDNIHLLVSSAPLKDLSLSFALFKLLWCGLAWYSLTNAGSSETLNIFYSLLMRV